MIECTHTVSDKMCQARKVTRVTLLVSFLCSKYSSSRRRGRSHSRWSPTAVRQLVVRFLHLLSFYRRNAVRLRLFSLIFSSLLSKECLRLRGCVRVFLVRIKRIVLCSFVSSRES